MAFFESIALSTVGKFSDFKLMLKSMPEGSHSFDYHLDKLFFANMESPDIRDANLDVKLTVVYRSNVYDLTFDITGTITLLCDRCLDELLWDVKTGYHIMVKYGEDYNDDSDELLVIPESDNYLNVAYMIYDTVALTIPPRHVHPQGKCNRAMSALLKKHRATSPDDEDADLENELIDEIDDIDNQPSTPVDPRWEGLKQLADDDL